MRYTSTVALLAILGLSAQPALAAASKKENIGVGTGAVVGALAGGPVGFIIGAAVGARLGDSANSRSQHIDSLQSSLQHSEARLAVRDQNIDELSIEVERLQRVARPELIGLMQAGIDMDLLFRTDEYALTDSTGTRLVQMAESIAEMPGVQLKLEGFADERGDAAYNQALSEKRVEFVRNLFISAGVHPTRISYTAHGESVAEEQNVDSYALERRVSVKLFIDEAQSLASNPIN